MSTQDNWPAEGQSLPCGQQQVTLFLIRVAHRESRLAAQI